MVITDDLREPFGEQRLLMVGEDIRYALVQYGPALNRCHLPRLRALLPRLVATVCAAADAIDAGAKRDVPSRLDQLGVIAQKAAQALTDFRTVL